MITCTPITKNNLYKYKEKNMKGGKKKSENFPYFMIPRLTCKASLVKS